MRGGRRWRDHCCRHDDLRPAGVTAFVMKVAGAARAEVCVLVSMGTSVGGLSRVPRHGKAARIV